MKLSSFLNTYYEFSGLASAASRQLAFAGIALIWIFKTQNLDAVVLPKELLLPAGALILSLGCDLLQYLSGSIIWHFFHRYHEKRRSTETDPEVEAPYWLHWPLSFFFVAKFFFVLMGFVFILQYCSRAISFS